MLKRARLSSRLFFSMTVKAGRALPVVLITQKHCWVDVDVLASGLCHQGALASARDFFVRCRFQVVPESLVFALSLFSSCCEPQWRVSHVVGRKAVEVPTRFSPPILYIPPVLKKSQPHSCRSTLYQSRRSMCCVPKYLLCRGKARLCRIRGTLLYINLFLSPQCCSFFPPSMFIYRAEPLAPSP